MIHGFASFGEMGKKVRAFAGETELSQHCELHAKEFHGYHNKKPRGGKIE